MLLRLKVVHRDIKLENILLDHSNRLKIIDFGLSTFMQVRRANFFFVWGCNSVWSAWVAQPLYMCGRSRGRVEKGLSQPQHLRLAHSVLRCCVFAAWETAEGSLWLPELRCP